MLKSSSLTSIWFKYTQNSFIPFLCYSYYNIDHNQFINQLLRIYIDTSTRLCVTWQQGFCPESSISSGRGVEGTQETLVELHGIPSASKVLGKSHWLQNHGDTLAGLLVEPQCRVPASSPVWWCFPTIHLIFPFTPCCTVLSWPPHYAKCLPPCVLNEFS